MVDEVSEGLAASEHQDSGTLKKKIVEQAADASVQTTEDPTRASLHYGENHTPDAAGRTEPNGSLEGTSADTTNAPSPSSLRESAASTATATQPGAQPTPFEGVAAPTPSNADNATETGANTPTQSATEPSQRPTQNDPSAPFPNANDDQQLAPDATPKTEDPFLNSPDENTATDETMAPSEPTASSDPKPDEQPSEASKEEPISRSSVTKTESVKAEPQQAAAEVDMHSNANTDEVSNTAPSEISLSANDVAESSAGAIIGQINVVDPDTHDTHSFTLSDNRFEVVDGSVKLKDGVSLDYEEAAEITLNVTATDTSGADFTQSFEINVADLNEGPESVSMSNAAVSENVDGATIGQLTIMDPDAGDTHAITLSDDRFEVVDGAVKLKDGVTLDHEDAAEITLNVTATDSHGAELTQSFEINVADLNEGPESISLSNAAVAENVEGAIIGQITVIDPDANDTHSFTLSDDRFEVVDGSVKLKDGISLDHDEAQTLSLEVVAIDSAGAEISQSFDVTVAEVPAATMTSGFHASYFDVDHSLSRLDQIDWDATPTHVELTNDINYTNSSNSFWEGGSKDTFGTKITGNIEVTEQGTFDFHIGGDDGVVLFINGVEVVENDGLHGFRTRSGEVELEPGTHVIEVRYFENRGHAGLKVEWEGPGIEGRQLLDAPQMEDLQTVNGMPLVMGIDLEQDSFGDAQIQNLFEGLPPGTILQTTNMSGEVGSDGTMDVTGWDTSMLSITPPLEFIGDVNATLSTHVTLEDGQIASTSMEVNFNVNEAQIDPQNVEAISGFHASYFDVDHTLRKLDDIDWNSEPTHEEVVAEVNYQNSSGSFWEGGATDTFGAKITGQVTVDEGGVYDFFVGGDDGVVLFINGIEVIDNDGLHGYRTRSGELELEPGTHEIEVRYFENKGHAGLKLEWDGPGTDGRELMQADSEMAVAENGILDIQITAESSDTVTISGLPADTIIVSGEETAISDGSDIDLTGWNFDMIEIMPPADFAGEINADIIVESVAFNGQETQTSIPLTIEVGDEEDWQKQDMSNEDEMLLAAEDSNSEASNGWADDSNDETAGGEQNGADPMEEQVEMQESSEQSHQSVETYERQDW